MQRYNVSRKSLVQEHCLALSIQIKLFTMLTQSAKINISENLPIRENVVHDTRIVSTFHLDLTQRFLDEDNAHHLTVYADQIFLKGDLYFPAKNISLYARVLTLEGDYTISTQVSESDLGKKSFPWSSPNLEAVPVFFGEVFSQEKKKAADLRSEMVPWLGRIGDELSSIKNDIDWLNQTLKLPDMYKAAAGRLTKLHPQLAQLIESIKDFQGKPYPKLTADEQDQIQKLNREIIDTLHPLETTQRIYAWFDYSEQEGALKGEGDQGLNKQDGGNGKPGYDGSNGSDGINGGDISILVGAVEFDGFRLTLDAGGTRGGRGQNGGQGGYGGKAGEWRKVISTYLHGGKTDVIIDGHRTFDVGKRRDQLIKDALYKAGRGGDGGNAGKSGNGGAGGKITFNCSSIYEAENISTIVSGGAAGENASGGAGGDGGTPPDITIEVMDGDASIFAILVNDDFSKEKVYGDRGPSGNKGRENIRAVPGNQGNVILERVDRDPFLFGFGDGAGLSDHRTITYHALKAYYLKGGAYMEQLTGLIDWLLYTIPDFSLISALKDLDRVPKTQVKEYIVMAALRTNVEVLQGYINAGLDFYGHSWNYVPVFSFEHYNSRIRDMLSTGRLVEEEHLKWKGEKLQQKNVAEKVNKTIIKINSGTNKIDNGFSQIISDRREIEDQLERYRLQMDREGSVIWAKQRSFMEAVDAKLKLAFGIGCLNLIAQVVLISTGNAAYGKYLKYGGTAIDKLKDVMGADKAYTDPIKLSFENSSKALEALDKYKQDKKEVKAKIIEDGDRQQIQLEINKKIEIPEPGSFKELYGKGADVVQHVLPVLGTAKELWDIGKKMGEAQEKFGFDAIKIAMDNQSYEQMIDQFAQYANAEAKAFKKAIGSYMELVKNRNELLLNYRALQVKSAELYAKNALLNAQLSLCRERLAQVEDPTVESMDQFWSIMYDFMRDRILDRIYDEYKTYRFYSVTDQPFSQTAVNNILRGQDEKKPSRDIAGEIELNPNISSLSILQDAVAEKMFAEEEKQFGSWKMFKNDAGRVSFQREEHEESFATLQQTGTAAFYISPDLPVFTKLAYLSIDSVEAFLIRKPGLKEATATKVSLLLYHEGFVSVKNNNGQILNYAHGKPNPFSYEYRSLYPHLKDQKAKFNTADRKLTDRPGDEKFYEVSGNQTVTNNKYIRINPCTWWTVAIDPENTTGLDMDDVAELVFQFSGRGIVINPAKKNT
ncbi:hypothetical protein [Pedobacter soli]|nr:hypothetical protein [Pedobacter soli]